VDGSAGVLSICGFMMLGLAGLFYSYPFLGVGEDYTFHVFLMIGMAIIFFGIAGWEYFKQKKEKNS